MEDMGTSILVWIFGVIVALVIQHNIITYAVSAALKRFKKEEGDKDTYDLLKLIAAGVAQPGEFRKYEVAQAKESYEKEKRLIEIEYATNQMREEKMNHLREKYKEFLDEF